MHTHLLDAGGAGLYYLLIMWFVGFMLIAILLEAAIMYLMKFNTRFPKTLLDSLVANIVTVVIGFALIEFAGDWFGDFAWNNILVFYVVTVLVEWGVLYLLNKNHSTRRALVVSVLMNIASYLVLLLFIGGRE